MKKVTLLLDDDVYEKITKESKDIKISLCQYANQVLRLNTLKIVVEPDKKRKIGPKFK